MTKKEEIMEEKINKSQTRRNNDIMNMRRNSILIPKTLKPTRKKN